MGSGGLVKVEKTKRQANSQAREEQVSKRSHGKHLGLSSESQTLDQKTEG
jgi:hypothetical protein